MKIPLLISLILGFSITGFSQGQVYVRNIFNTDPSPSATANGLVSTCPGLITNDFNLQIYGGVAPFSLTLLASYIGAAAVGINAAGPGTFNTPDILTVPGATNIAYFQILAWTGNAPDFASATERGMTPPFRNPVGDPNGTPPATPFELDSMPALSLCAIPEPGSLTLVGLAAAVVLVVHRLAMRLYKR